MSNGERGNGDERPTGPEVFGAGAERPGPERAGDRVGPYHLLEVLGEGGFGVVWLAERREPMVQRVALKIIKPGMDTRAVVGRFEQERQALALMDHPNVARVLDGGATAWGRPYFVMELVRGLPITDYCDRNRLRVRERLALFATVCDAVQHAHIKGVIHRDLKPSNILVVPGEGGAGPVVKVIDFGVAKAIARTLTAKTVFTELGMIVGTPEYMSPEQADFSAEDIDTRADVYSLGVVLYELLTGSLPFDSRSLRSGGYAEIQRIIREVEPPRPSLRLSTADKATGARIAHARQQGRERLAGELRRELEWIPLKAMEKDRRQRYASAESFGSDVRRYLSGEPLIARRRSALYAMRKFVSRHRVGVLAAGVTGLAVVLGLAGTAWGWTQSRAEAARAARLLSITTGLLQGVSGESSGTQVSVSGLLDDVAAGVKADASGDDFVPTVELALASGYRKVGRVAEARELAREALGKRTRALGPDDPRTLEAALSAANLDAIAGNFAQAELDLRALAERADRVLGADAPIALRARLNAAFCAAIGGRHAEALAEYRVLLPRAEKSLARDDRDLAEARLQYAGVMMASPEGETPAEMSARHARAIEEYGRIAAGLGEVFGPRDALTLRARAKEAIAMMYAGRFADAVPIFAEAVPGLRAMLGDTDQDTMEAVGSAAYALVQVGRVGEARELLRGVLPVVEWGSPADTEGLKGLREAWSEVEQASAPAAGTP
jgi:serine/threonine protein kinase/tetratricopeptide (TPR) repeat protein